MLEIINYIQLAKMSVDLLRAILDLIDEFRNPEAQEEEEQEGKQQSYRCYRSRVMSQQDYPCWLLLCLGEVSFKMDSRGISNDLGINGDFRYMSIVA